MNNLFLILFLLSSFAIVIALINPRWLGLQSRLKALGITFVASLIFLIAFGYTIPESEKTTEQEKSEEIKQEEEKEKQEEAEAKKKEEEEKTEAKKKEEEEKAEAKKKEEEEKAEAKKKEEEDKAEAEEKKKKEEDKAEAEEKKKKEEAEKKKAKKEKAEKKKAEEEKPTNVIKGNVKRIVNKDLDRTTVTKLRVNEDASVDEERYIVLVDLEWDVKNGAKNTKTMLDKYSDHLAAKLTDDKNIYELVLFWTVPYHNEDENILKKTFENKDKGMYLENEFKDTTVFD